MKILLFYLTLLFVPLKVLSCANPFEISFPEKAELTTEDYVQVQALIKKIDIDAILRDFYPNPAPANFASYQEFKSRCGRGIQQVLIDPKANLYPEQKLRQVGTGGDRCIVCCVPFQFAENDHRAKLSEGIYDALEKTGFNGHYLQFTGGFPNPTGKELRLAAVPYSFKIFMMLEASKRGFNHVIWIDAACLPINNLSPLFDKLEKTQEAVFFSYKMKKIHPNYIFQQTVKTLEELTHTSFWKNKYVNTMVFGLKMNSPKVQNLITEYYKMVELGTPFLSVFPEEFVLSAILGKPEYKSLHSSGKKNSLLKHSNSGTDTPELIEKAQKDGIFFWQRQH